VTLHEVDATAPARSADAALTDAPTASTCPMPRALRPRPAGRCPAQPGASTCSARGIAETVVRRILRVPDRKVATNAEAQRLFGPSMLLSALRCLLTYVVFPIVTPLLGTAAAVGPAIGIPIAVLALVFDVMGIRRFWLANHKWRWIVSAVYLGVMALVTVLLVGDVVQLA
jgi:hypothetical protein